MDYCNEGNTWGSCGSLHTDKWAPFSGPPYFPGKEKYTITAVNTSSKSCRRNPESIGVENYSASKVKSRGDYTKLNQPRDYRKRC